MKNIWAVGRNFEAHAKELGNLLFPAGSVPIIFLKASGTVVPNGRQVQLPRWSEDVQHELEIAIRLGVGLNGELSVNAFTIALDLTARDIQAQLKKDGHPWTLAKSFKDSCPLGDWVPAAKLGRSDEEILAALNKLEFTLKVNEEERQHGFTKNMIHKLDVLLAYIAERFPVEDGDILLMGSPEGVSTLKPGDRVDAEILGYTKANWQFV